LAPVSTVIICYAAASSYCYVDRRRHISITLNQTRPADQSGLARCSAWFCRPSTPIRETTTGQNRGWRVRSVM
jgi:hypothetical protein